MSSRWISCQEPNRRPMLRLVPSKSNSSRWRFQPLERPTVVGSLSRPTAGRVQPFGPDPNPKRSAAKTVVVPLVHLGTPGVWRSIIEENLVVFMRVWLHALSASRHAYLRAPSVSGGYRLPFSDDTVAVSDHTPPSASGPSDTSPPPSPSSPSSSQPTSAPVDKNQKPLPSRLRHPRSFLAVILTTNIGSRIQEPEVAVVSPTSLPALRRRPKILSDRGQFDYGLLVLSGMEVRRLVEFKQQLDERTPLWSK
ncbi:hypothetical protein C8F04DRAFT_1184313 [Mycena alexandri]|uniref:Uncharacterized protein n=1 Tax=Mycena alexandri TaxID=1745969 RepID=A0AAD6SSX2_9AGAR|nr:hypothetical protein C8F04DRAFT_1184313 [Mycena alexandri]